MSGKSRSDTDNRNLSIGLSHSSDKIMHYNNYNKIIVLDRKQCK